MQITRIGLLPICQRYYSESTLQVYEIVSYKLIFKRTTFTSNTFV